MTNATLTKAVITRIKVARRESTENIALPSNLRLEWRDELASKRVNLSIAILRSKSMNSDELQIISRGRNSTFLILSSNFFFKQKQKSKLKNLVKLFW